MTSLNDYRLYGSKKADASIDLSAPVAAPVVEDDTFEEEKAAATASVPTSTSKKEDVRAYLMYEGKVLREGASDYLINDEVSRALYLGEKFSM